jgi:hypothetical protein
VAIFAETLVEEWLNRRGFFTIRGAKGGLLEMDLLAVRYREDKEPEAVHYEVQASTGPISWMTRWTPELQKELDIGPNNARKRDKSQMEECVNNWIYKKFRDPRVEEVREKLWPDADWRFALVHGVVKHTEELPVIAEHGVEVLDLSVVLDELMDREGKDRPVKTTSSTAADIAALIGVDRALGPREG